MGGRNVEPMSLTPDVAADDDDDDVDDPPLPFLLTNDCQLFTRFSLLSLKKEDNLEKAEHMTRRDNKHTS